MEFRLLGPLEVVGEKNVFGIAAHKPRALLALLLLNANEIVPAERLIEALWDGAPPASAPKVLQTYVSQLRKELGAERIVTRGPGYLISVAPGELDLEHFQSASDPREALALWRGTPLADFEYDTWAEPEIARLGEARLGMLEERIELDLADGRHAEVVAELEALVGAHPLRERLRGQLMLALYRCGRQADALASYREARQLLVGELGIEPSAQLQRLERSILRQDDTLEMAPPRRPVEPQQRLVGRESALREIARLVEASPLTTLVGPGGIGKTRLALEIVRGASDRYADGVVVVELAALTDPRLVPTEIAQALGVPEDALGAYLGGKELLLVLDNFEQVAAAAPLLAELIALAPSLSVLATSRTPLHLAAETLYHVPPLPPPEAVTLFVERARGSRPEFELTAENAGSIEELCVRLDGLPLALELAGARAALLSPSAILARLGRRLDLLKAADSTVPDRHRTLRAAIEWSYDLLDSEQQALFSSLAVFSGGFSADAAEAVAATDVLDGLAALLDSSLLRMERPVGDEPRFGMLETIREYGLERFSTRSDAEELRRRHASFYCVLAERGEPALRGHVQVAWLRRLDAERENLRSVLTSGDTELGLRAASSLWRYWQVRGGVGEGRAHLERLLAQDGAVSTPVRAAALAAAGRLAFMYGDLIAAEALIEESLGLHAGGRALSLVVLAMVAQANQNHARARDLLDESSAAAQAEGDWFSHALALVARGECLYVDGEFDDARRSLEEGVRAAREAGDLRNIARGLAALGAVALEQRDYEHATRLLEEALAAQRELGDRWGIPRSLVSLGVAELGRGRSEQAAILFEQGLTLQLEADDRPGIAASLEQIAALNAQSGDHECAACLYGAATILREMVGTHPLQLVSHGRDKTLAAISAALPADAFADAWSRGRATTLDEVVSYALDRTRRNSDVRHALG